MDQNFHGSRCGIIFVDLYSNVNKHVPRFWSHYSNRPAGLIISPCLCFSRIAWQLDLIQLDISRAPETTLKVSKSWPIFTARKRRRGEGMRHRGRAWQERRPLQRAVRILLECILVCRMSRGHVYRSYFTVRTN